MPDIIVHHLPGAWGLPSISPFCLKVDAYLRIMKIPFRVVIDATPFKGPKGKLPWIEHDGYKVGDSGFIIEYLERRLACDANAGLTPSERAVALSMRRLIEENLYWTMVYDRWVVEENWHGFRDVVLGGIPMPMRLLVAPIARRGVKRQLIGHGLGLHTPDEIHAIGLRDVVAVADFLADKPYLMGDKPTELDATGYGFLANIMNVPIESPVRDEARSRTNLVAYLERMQRVTAGDSCGASD